MTVFLLTSCKTEMKKHETYRGIIIPIKSRELVDTVNTLINKGELSNLTLSDGSLLLAFPGNFYGVAYFNCFTLKYDGTIIV